MNNALKLILLQLFSKSVSFIFNTLLLRLTNPQLIGLVTLRYEFLLSTILFLSKEGFRGALLRVPLNIPSTPTSSSKQHVSTLPQDPSAFSTNANLSSPSKQHAPSTTTLDLQTFITLAWIPLPYFFLLALLLWHLHSSSFINETYHAVFCIYLLSAFIQFSFEPIYIALQCTNFPQVRIKIEGYCIFIRSCVILCTLVILNSPSLEHQLFIFAAAQLATDLGALLAYYLYASYLLGCSMAFFWPNIHRLLHYYQRIFFGRPLPDAIPLEEQSLTLALTLSTTNIATQLLNQGDLFVINCITLCASPHDSPQLLKEQGYYSIANNYGSLVPRIILQPIEEATFISSSNLPAASTNSQKPSPAQPPRSFFLWLKFEAYLSLIFIVFGSFFVGHVITIIFGSNAEYLGIVSGLLSAYCYYIPLISLNGLLDSWLTAVSSSDDLAANRKLLFISTFLFYILVGFPILYCRNFLFTSRDASLSMAVMAMNAANTIQRILLNLYRWKVKRRLLFSELWLPMLPPKSVSSVFLALYMLHLFFLPSSPISAISLGTANALFALTAIYFLDATYVHEFYALMKAKK